MAWLPDDDDDWAPPAPLRPPSVITIDEGDEHDMKAVAATPWRPPAVISLEEDGEDLPWAKPSPSTTPSLSCFPPSSISRAAPPSRPPPAPPSVPGHHLINAPLHKLPGSTYRAAPIPSTVHSAPAAVAPFYRPVPSMGAPPRPLFHTIYRSDQSVHHAMPPVNDYVDDQQKEQRAKQVANAHLVQSILQGLAKHPGFFDIGVLDKSLKGTSISGAHSKDGVPFPIQPDLDDGSSLLINAPPQSANGSLLPNGLPKLFDIQWEDEKKSLKRLASDMATDSLVGGVAHEFAQRLAAHLCELPPHKRRALVDAMEGSGAL